MIDGDDLEEPRDAGWLAGAEVAIVGLGLMGGSLAAALSGHGGHGRCCRRVVGIVRRAEHVAPAQRVVDLATTDLAGVSEADVVVLATPPGTILTLLPTVARYMKQGSLLTDLGSTKSLVVSVMSTLPGSIRTAGGHPMCGKESGGLEAADAALYRNAPWVVCPVGADGDPAVQRVMDLARAVGARPLRLTADVHDRAVAAVSHLPYLAAVGVVRAAQELAATDGDVLWSLAAGGFRDTTRVAASPVDLWSEILLTNAPEVLAQLARLQHALGRLEDAIRAGDAEAIRSQLAGAHERRRTLFQAPAP